MLERDSNGTLTILAFPCNQFFLQEPAENHELLNGLKHINQEMAGNRIKICIFPANSKLMVKMIIRFTNFWKYRSFISVIENTLYFCFGSFLRFEKPVPHILQSILLPQKMFSINSSVHRSLSKQIFNIKNRLVVITFSMNVIIITFMENVMIIFGKNSFTGTLLVNSASNWKSSPVDVQSDRYEWCCLELWKILDWQEGSSTLSFSSQTWIQGTAVKPFIDELEREN